MDYEDLINKKTDNNILSEETAISYNTMQVSESCLNDKTPYTIEELDTRLEQAEKDFGAGRYFSNESVIAELNQFIRELNSRIDESERQMEAGDTISGEQVHEEMRNYLKSLTA